jgi:hypothetical protein
MGYPTWQWHFIGEIGWVHWSNGPLVGGVEHFGYGQIRALHATQLVHIAGSLCRKSVGGKIISLLEDLESLVCRLSAFEIHAKFPHGIFYSLLALANDTQAVLVEPTNHEDPPLLELRSLSSGQMIHDGNENQTQHEELARNLERKWKLSVHCEPQFSFPIDYSMSFFHACKNSSKLSSTPGL